MYTEKSLFSPYFQVIFIGIQKTSYDFKPFLQKVGRVKPWNLFFQGMDKKKRSLDHKTRVIIWHKNPKRGTIFWGKSIKTTSNNLLLLWFPPPKKNSTSHLHQGKRVETTQLPLYCFLCSPCVQPTFGGFVSHVILTIGVIWANYFNS